jgi:hypothetical protein
MTIINQDNFPFVETNLLGLVPAEAFEVEIVCYLLGTVQKKTSKFPQIAMISVPGKFLLTESLNLFQKTIQFMHERLRKQSDCELD